jgi:formamidopyrimidine-DNA glycosylase
VVTVLTAGLGAGGATIDDFRHADGVHGAFQDQFLVHRRRGEACPVCGGTIVKLVVAGRGTYVCERCQRPPRGARRQLAG